MRLGIFGGSFDPIHLGHLILAEYCLQQANLNQMIFMPAGQSPLKKTGPKSNHKQRLEMLRLAIGGHPRFEASTLELDRQGPSYTVDSLSEIQQQYSQDELFFLMGADSLADFATHWRGPARICQLAIPLVVARRGYPLDLQILKPLVDHQRWKQILDSQIVSPVIEISSTEIRADVEARRSIRFRVPRAVEVFIETEELYRSPSIQ